MSLPHGFVPPCLPTKASQPPSGDAWLHEIKHDGFRVIARKDGDRVRLYSRPGNDLTDRFRLIVEALVWLRARSCIIDGEAVCCGRQIGRNSHSGPVGIRSKHPAASFPLLRHAHVSGRSRWMTIGFMCPSITSTV
jgi:bifunctional non-homologous end joining protein LigD